MQKTFRKITALLMAFMLLFACFGCSSDSDKDNEKEGVESNGKNNGDIDSPTKLNFVDSTLFRQAMTIQSGLNQTVRLLLPVVMLSAHAM